MEDDVRKIDRTLIMRGPETQAKQSRVCPTCNEEPQKAFEKDRNTGEECYVLFAVLFFTH